MKVVINACHGGFGLSDKALDRLGLDLLGLDSIIRICRHDPALVTVVEELGKEVNDECSKLKIVQIPDNTEYDIYDETGFETIHEKHRIWD